MYFKGQNIPYRANNMNFQGLSFSQNRLSQGQQKKHSGAKTGQDKNSNPYVRGWKFDKFNGLRSFYCTPYTKTKRVTSGNGRTWENWLCKVTKADGSTALHSCMCELSTMKVTINDLSFVINPKASNGGYTGKYYRSK